MDHVNRRAHIVRLLRIERKIKEAKHRQNKTQKNPQIDRNPPHTLVKFLQYFNLSHNTFLVLKGVAAGVAITTIAWWSKSGVIEDSISMTVLKTSGANQTIQTTRQQTHPPEIKHSNQNFDLINMRMELLTDYINHMEGKLKRVILLTESIIDIENKYVSASHQNTHEFTDSESEVETLQYTDTRLISTPPHIDEMFTPTHTVNARLHLRRSASSESTALAVIEVGSRVEYIRQDGDWYYVNAPSYGEGWCSSDYLSPLPQNQQRTTSIGVITAASKMDKKFTPTHTVKARLNLRRSASSESTAIAVMEAGSRVEYIRKSNGWYYVKTASYGEGWCSSEYLSTSLENQQYASVI